MYDDEHTLSKGDDMNTTEAARVIGIKPKALRAFLRLSLIHI